MKKYMSIVLMLLSVQLVSAKTFYEQLCEFNFNWKKYSDRAPAENKKVFLSDKEYIQAHLTNVLIILRENPTDHLTSEQRKVRAELIEVLDGYRERGLFPMNYYREERIPVFIDEHNTHCAVGYLLKETGYEKVARRISATDNYAWVKDINDPALPKWQKFSGFTLEELKLIQGAYDSYMPGALFLPNRYEIPQKPEPMLVYFESELTGEQLEAKPENVWCKGEGRNGVLHGRWEQNYGPGIPWIVGYYSNGQRTGQWKEYYQGTNKLCRTENWRNDKLNGLRRRFDRSGKLIEEIFFKDGKAVTKKNYDLINARVSVRKPLDSTMVWTEIYTDNGQLLAKGLERVYNPGNLMWFQNIELTALNTAAITSRDFVTTSQPIFGGSGDPFMRGNQLYNAPPLVQYFKEGEWKYYMEFDDQYTGDHGSKRQLNNLLIEDYRNFGSDLSFKLSRFNDHQVRGEYDSLLLVFNSDYVEHVYGYGNNDYTHLRIFYQEDVEDQISPIIGFHNYYPYEVNAMQTFRLSPRVKSTGEYNEEGKRVGLWKHYDQNNQLFKTENYLIPKKEEEMVGMTR